MFKKNIIKNRIFSALNAIIDQAQASYENECQVLDTECQKAHEELDTELVLRKATAADRLVDGIVGKFK